MHSHTQVHDSDFGFHWSPANVALTILLALLFLIFLFLFFTLTTQPAQAQTHSGVPPTAREAAAMPQFAAKLAHARQTPSLEQPPASYKSPRDARASGRRGLLPADNVYDNGPINGNTDAWTINFGFVVSDTFTTNGSQITGLHFGAWLSPGDLLQSVEVSISSQPLGGGTIYFDQVVNFTQQTNCPINTYGYAICTESGSFTASNVPSGTAWLNLQNATVNTGDPIYWDENSGSGCQSQGCPSQAEENGGVGTIPSEAFTIEGNPGLPACPQDEPLDNFKIIHDFTGNEQTPTPGLVIDQSGKVYGASPGGDHGFGLLYQLAQHGEDWILNSLYSFLGGTSGQNPLPGVLGPDGASYGTADGGGNYCGARHFCGEVYRLTPGPTACLAPSCSWMETVIHSFTGDPDGWSPNGNLVFDRAGNLYGTTLQGGAYGFGTVYELTRSNGVWTERVIYSFTGGSGGGGPSSLLVGHDGDLYGIAGDTVFQLVPSGSGWTLNVIAQAGGSSLVQDSAGNLYFFFDGQCGPGGRDGYGVIYMLSYGDWTLTVLANTLDWFPFECTCQYHDCYNVFHGLAVDGSDQLWVTGGGENCNGVDCYIFSGGVGVLRGREGVDFGSDVFRDVHVGADGKVYGTTGACNSHGTVWQLSP